MHLEDRMSTIKEKFEALKPETRQRIFVSGFVGLAVMLTLGLYFQNRIQTPPTNNEQATTKVTVGNKLAENSVMTMIEGLKKDNAALRQDLENVKKTQPNSSVPAPGAGTVTPVTGTTTPVPGKTPTSVQQIDNIINNKQGTPTTKPAPEIPPPRKPEKKRVLTPIPKPDSTERVEYKGPPPPKREDPRNLQGKLPKVGGIMDVPADTSKKADSTVKAGANESKKKATNVVHLPVSFMAAKTMNGLAVPATENGKGDPAPMIIRVSTPAVLPNGVSAQVSGCFFVAEGVGSLQEERARIRLVSLTCLSKKGQALIEHDISGFVEDSDGLPGLKGRVVAKFGAAVARAAAAGFIGGIGDGMAQTSSTNNITSLGTVQTYGTSAQDIGIAAVGKGISGATKEIQKFYMELAHQSLPVIEVGNGKNITVVVTKGVDLEIKTYNSVMWD
jgi:conjugal transfer pilus assembly protein TraB